MEPFYFIPALLLIMAAVSAAVCLAYRRFEPISLSGRTAKAGRLLDSGRAGEAIPLLTRAIDENHPEESDLCDLSFMLGTAYLSAGEPEQAVDQFDRAISLSLGKLEYSYSHEITKIYEAYLKTGQRDKAEKFCRYLMLSNEGGPIAEQILQDAAACGLHPMGEDQQES